MSERQDHFLQSFVIMNVEIAKLPWPQNGPSDRNPERQNGVEGLLMSCGEEPRDNRAQDLGVEERELRLASLTKGPDA